jgi:hypothetical protein
MPPIHASLPITVKHATMVFLSYPSVARPSNPILVGKDGLRRAHNAYVISLTFPDGTRVTSIPAGTYAYACSAHFRTMNGAFTVTAQ